MSQTHLPTLDPTDADAVQAALDEALNALGQAGDLEELKAVRIKYTGEKSPLALANRAIGSLDKSLKAQAGKVVGSTRGKLTQAFNARQTELEEERAARLLVEESVDVSAAPRRHRLGARHPLATLQEKVSDIFVGMGWEIAEGPELEHEWFNFDALNTKPDHPARELQDTFFVEPASSHVVLRTQTSPVQVRALLDRDLPVYMLAPGRVYRRDEIDATHLPVFYQFEGLAVDKGLTMADLRGTLEHFARLMFGPDTKIRLRPHFFPFTEPSAEMDVWHPDAKGGAQWIEWGGCGMVHPNVLRAAGVDPEEYSGFAFGMGVERTLMFRNGALDMRDMIEGDTRFSTQFGMEI